MTTGIYGGSRVIVDFAAPQSVSTLTVLSPFTSYGSAVGSLLFCITNLSSTETLTVSIDTSEDGVLPDSERAYSISAPPNTQASLEVGPELLRTYWRISANTQGPGFNNALVKWRIKGSFARSRA